MDISANKPNKPNNNLAWSLVTLLACCMPLGIVSLVYSMKVDTLYFQGQHKEAQENAELAKKWAIWGIIAAMIFWSLYFLFLFVPPFLFIIIAAFLEIFTS